ncbi:hypothetical protein F383_16309 [Gossypium arboreum]|uniref:Uncharacterized protein n=1 Tax=Gossypium arboreum TaxID=29729 RepID=A0A0B0PTW1_GOSAR|nr:hypothetical protein F383_16309 [Gossypium arboreum]
MDNCKYDMYRLVLKIINMVT